MAGLFRPESVKAQRHRLLGDVIIAQPLSITVLTAFLACAVAAIVTFVSLSSYARKVTVSGFLSPDKGIVRVHAPRRGVIGSIHVSEGEFVEKGAALITLLGEQKTGDGVVVDDAVLLAIDRQLVGIEAQRQLDRQLHLAESKRLVAEKAGLGSEAEAIEVQLGAQRQLVARLASKHERMRSVADRGFISSDEYLEREENLLIARQVMANLLQQQLAKATELQRTELALERLPLELSRQDSELRSLQADLELRRIELEARRSIIVTAPVSGRVTALRAIAGEWADSTLPLLTVLPDNGRLEAQLFVPTRAVGFVEAGQEVRLLYDAFDYRRFGVHAGTISGMSSSVFSPAETRLGTRVSEPTYRVTVEIGSQSVRAYGREFRLQAGMSLRADIVLEKRSLIEWLLDPLLSLRGRA